MSTHNVKEYGFYSKTQEGRNMRKTISNDDGTPTRNIRHNIYELVSGEEVPVTEIVRDPKYTSNFKDVVNLGEIKRWVRVVYW